MADLIDRRAVAEALGVHPQTVTKWESAGMPVAARGSRGRPSRYDLAACIRWHVARELKARSVAPAAIDAKAERALLARRRREELELRLAVRRGELLEAAQVTRDTFEAFRILRDTIQNVPARCSGALAATTDPAALEIALGRELRLALESASSQMRAATEPQPCEGVGAVGAYQSPTRSRGRRPRGGPEY